MSARAKDPEIPKQAGLKEHLRMGGGMGKKRGGLIP